MVYPHLQSTFNKSRIADICEVLIKVPPNLAAEKSALYWQELPDVNNCTEPTPKNPSATGALTNKRALNYMIVQYTEVKNAKKKNKNDRYHFLYTQKYSVQASKE